jgi:hypothetical protein
MVKVLQGYGVIDSLFLCDDRGVYCWCYVASSISSTILGVMGCYKRMLMSYSYISHFLDKV